MRALTSSSPGRLRFGVLGFVVLTSLPALTGCATPTPAPERAQVAAFGPPEQAPAPGDAAWREMEGLLHKTCADGEGGPHRAETCRRLSADFARGHVVFRSAQAARASWAYGWLAFADLGGGAWGGAVFHRFDERWLLVGFDGHDPAVARPACGSAEWRGMADALAVVCAAPDPRRPPDLCPRLSEGFARCTADLRDAIDLRPRWGVGLAAVTPLAGAIWGAAAFRKVEGKWMVAGFDGGEIK